MKVYLFISLLVFMFLSCSNGEISKGALHQKVLPGDDQIDISKISMDNLTYTKPSGRMTFNIDKLGDKNKFKLFIDFVVDGRSAPDTVYFDAKTLAFSNRHFYNAWGDYTGKLDFSTKKLTGSLSPNSKDSQLKSDLVYNKEFEHGVFEPAMLSYLIGTLPLKLGYKASLPMLDLDNGSKIIWANIEVVKRESINSNGKKYETWKINSNGSRNKVFWISTHNGYLVKMKNKGVWFNWKLNQNM